MSGSQDRQGALDQCRSRRGARNHGEGWVPTGAAAKWAAARIDRMHWISAGTTDWDQEDCS